MGEALQRYAELTDPERASIKSHIWSATRPLKNWCRTIENVVAFDELGDQERVKERNRFFFALVPGVLLFFVSGFFLVLGPVGIAILALLAISSGVGTIFFGFRWRRLAKTDVPNSLREFIAPLVMLLAEDLDPEQPVTISFDLNRERPSHFQGPAKSLPLPKKVGMFGSGITGIKERHRIIPCFHLEGQLPDGSKLVVDVKDFERVRTVSKRNPRGKHKTKVKTKARRVVDAQLTLPHKRYSTAGGSASVKTGERRSTLRHKAATPLDAKNTGSSEPVLKVLAALFAQARPAA